MWIEKKNRKSKRFCPNMYVVHSKMNVVHLLDFGSITNVRDVGLEDQAVSELEKIKNNDQNNMIKVTSNTKQD